MLSLSRMRVLLALLLALAAQPVLASFTVNQTAGGSNATPSTTLTVSITVASGHTVCAYAHSRDGNSTIGTITDSGGNTYTNRAANTGGIGASGTACSIGIATGITSVTLTPVGGAPDNLYLIVWDITATGTITYADSKSVVYSFNTTTATDGMTTGSMTLSASDGLFLAGAVNLSSGTIVAGTGVTQSYDGGGSFRGFYKAASASGALTLTSSASGDFVQIASVALQVGAAPPPPSTSLLTM